MVAIRAQFRAYDRARARALDLALALALARIPGTI